MLIVGPEFERANFASLTDDFVKFCPSTSSNLSCTFKKHAALECSSISLTYTP